MTISRTVGCLFVAGLWFAEPVAAAQGRGAADKPQPAVQPAPKPQANPDALTLQDFKKRIDAYLDLHKKAGRGAPPFKQTNDPAEIKAAQAALAANIRAARAGAKAGDIFSPEIRERFRKLLSPEMKGEDGKDAKEVLKDDAPLSVPLKVNADYPEGAALPTVPASVLGNLPTLPEELEYRIIDKHLILRDTKAGIIVDFIPNVMR